MGELLSVGIDVGTTTTQLILSRLTVENRSSAFTVPEMVIGEREIRYRSPVYFTPLLAGDLVDGEGIREIVAREYERAGVRREEADTGAIIITGETSRKENAGAVLRALEGFAGDFVAATAGPDLESVLAARGAGAVAYSAESGKRVLHMDIGGGTSNLALIEDGKITATGCLNVGGRLIKCGENGAITYISPVLDGICDLEVGEMLTEDAAEAVADTLVQALEMAAGLREVTGLLEKLWTRETSVIASQSADWRGNPRKLPEYSGGCHVGLWPPRNDSDHLVFSFSGGVADCIETEHFWREFGDIGPVLGRKIRKSRLCAGEYRLGGETIRATVIGAGCHSVQLSGSTVFHRGVEFPLKNRPVVCLTEREQELDGDALASLIGQRLAGQDEDAVLALPGFSAPGYGRIVALGNAIRRGFGDRPIAVAVEADMAKALGQRLAVETSAPVLCIDDVRLGEGSYLDVGAPVGPAMPVVVKTLILER